MLRDGAGCVRFASSRAVGGRSPSPSAPHPCKRGKERILRWLAIIFATFAVAVCLAPSARSTAQPQPARIQHISQRVFGSRWRVAACIAFYESTDGARLYNGSNLGPWQINVEAHPWANPRLLVANWLYSARAAFRISDGGRDWSPWTTHGLCGV